MKINMQKGFTLIEIIVVMAIIAVLYGIILFSVNLYISKGKDSNVSGNLAILVPAGEVWYNSYVTYSNFCDPAQNSALNNAISQTPDQPTGAPCYNASTKKGVCCKVASDGLSWAACAREFVTQTYAYCVDSRGVKKDIAVGLCSASMATACP
jgi:prepilin-type N-terminal cleavage/methylation domain-containing protein